MIDIHSHILPALDDGARSLDESVAMVRMAAASGTTDIVATPHSNYEFSYDAEAVTRKVSELEQASGHALRIHRGCDFHLSASNILDALEHPNKYTINAKNYLLVEFPEMVIPTSIDGVFSRLGNRGITPIITHPERNSVLQRQLSHVEDWVQGGCLVQVTAQSLIGTFGKAAHRTAHELLEAGLVHFVASDAHDLKHRPPVALTL